MTVALIAGRGALPLALTSAMPERPLVAALDGFVPDGLVPDVTFRIERLVPFFRLLEDRGVTQVIFAGAVTRPHLDPALIDPATAQLVPTLMAAMRGGDDATLRAVLGVFEDFGFAVMGVPEVAPDLVPGEGILAGMVTETERADAARAAAIVAALGAVDVGQGAVVQEGLCLATEALPGTDAMLRYIADLGPLRPTCTRTRGLFYKAPKPGQDRRVDLPTIGPETVALVGAARLGGIAWEAGGVICLDLPTMIDVAKDERIFLWARGP